MNTYIFFLFFLGGGVYFFMVLLVFVGFNHLSLPFCQLPEQCVKRCFYLFIMIIIFILGGWDI